MNKHTPGPWTPFFNDQAIGVSTKRSDIAWVWNKNAGLGDSLRSREEDEANARLIAAAPDLLEAAQKVLSHKRGEDDWLILAVYCRELEAAIAKATGEQQ